MNKSIRIELTTEEFKVLERRAKKELLTPQGLVEDIIRRSMVSYKRGGTHAERKVDDAFVNIFSRERRGRKQRR